MKWKVIQSPSTSDSFIDTKFEQLSFLWEAKTMLEEEIEPTIKVMVSTKDVSFINFHTLIGAWKHEMCDLHPNSTRLVYHISVVLFSLLFVNTFL